MPEEPFVGAGMVGSAGSSSAWSLWRMVEMAGDKG